MKRWKKILPIVLVGILVLIVLNMGVTRTIEIGDVYLHDDYPAYGSE